jgi:hypothetical protein
VFFNVWIRHKTVGCRHDEETRRAVNKGQLGVPLDLEHVVQALCEGEMGSVFLVAAQIKKYNGHPYSKVS